MADVCRTGCKTRDHLSYADCLADINVGSGYMNSSLAPVFDQTKRDLKAYATARANGIWPSSTTEAKVRDAERASRLLGRPYDSGVDAPSSKIVNQATARYSNMKD